MKQNKHFERHILFPILTDEKSEATPDQTSKIADVIMWCNFLDRKANTEK